MGGGLMQLVAYGAQDIYLTGNPQITFFKVVYRRHTNFSMETIQQTVNGASTPTTSDTTGTVTISRNGDLVSKVYVRVNANDGTDCVSGDQLIKDVTLEIGGQQIDKHTREWLQIWAELSTTDSKATGYKYLTGGFSNTLNTGNTAGTVGRHAQQSVMVPLQFWFCRNPGLALPLIALQYHEVKMKFTWGKTSEIARDDGTHDSAPACEVWCDYIYLDTDERRRFAQVSHEYLIEQLQYQTEGTANSKYKLNFNHPVKELVWTNASAGIVAQKTKLTLNGHDRFAQQDKEYFQIRQPLDHHTAVPGYNIKESENVSMLAQHLPAGKADLDTYITYAAATDKITDGVVDIGTAAGTNPVVGDVVKVIEHRPLQLGNPICVTNAINLSVINAPDADGEFRVLAATTSNLKLFSSDADDIDINVGDILSISYPGTTGEEVTITVKVSAIVTAPADGAVAVYTVTFAGGMGAASTPVASVNGDGSIFVTSRLGNIEVGTGVVTVVGTSGTDFTLSNNDIVTTHDFKMHIVGRLQNPVSRCSQLARDVNVYSFALKPEEHQPSGTCNFSRIDTAHLSFSASATVQNIYAVNYNVLRVMSGMGGLAYSN